MATRSTIALEFADGTIGQVYCHWDGYLAHNGKMLMEYYSNPFILRDLIDLGSLSSLRPQIGTKHPFSMFEANMTQDEYANLYRDMCTFYGRDREEEGQEFVTHTSKESLIEQFNDSWCEFAYIMQDGVWYVMFQGDSEFYLLSEELVKDKETQE